MDSRRRAASLAGLVVALNATAVAAQARETVLSIAIPEQARPSALMTLGRQAGVSMGFAPGARCSGVAAVSGRMDLDQALARLLDGSDCVASRPDPRTVVIRARPWPRPAAPLPVPASVQSSTELAEVVVTAGKTETLLSASPYGLTATTGAELDRRGVTNVGDLSLLAAGVTVTNLGPGRDKVLLRGLSDGPLTGHTQSTVGLYLGDLRLTYNAPDPNLPLVDVARVEVLRGPQGSLYGAGSIGGILQVVPRAPDTTIVSGRVSIVGSATAHGARSGGVEGMWNQPLGGDAAVRAVAWSEIAGGYLDNPGLGRSNVDRSRRRGIRLSGLWRASDELTLEATFIDQTIATRDAHYADAGARGRATTVAEPHDNDFLALVLAAHWAPSWGRLTASIGALDHDVSTTYDATAAPPSLVAGGGHPLSFEDGNEIRGLVSEVRAASTGGQRLRWTAGVFNAVGDQRLDADLEPVEPVAGYSEVRRDRLWEGAAFGEASYDLSRDLTLTVGGRFYGSRLRTRSDISLGVPIRSFAGRTHDVGFAPKLLAAYRPNPGLTVYVQAAEGYRTGGFNTSGPAGQGFGSATGDPQPLRRYAGDELWNYEAGLRWRSPERGLAVRTAVFQANWTDIQADLVLPSGLPFTANLGNGRSRGVEIEGGYERGRLSLSGNLVWQDPDLVHPAPGLSLSNDSALPGVPDLSYAATAFYRLPLGSRHDLDLAASYTYVGRSRLNLDRGKGATMGDYGDLQLSATWQAGDLSVRLSIENALDSHGDTLAFGNPFSFRLARHRTPQRPRTLGLRVTRGF